MKIAMLLAAAALPLAMPAAASAMPLAPRVGAALLQPVAYGDLPTSGPRRRGRKHAPSAKDPDPTVPDLHGATREDADKLYRKKYGF